MSFITDIDDLVRNVRTAGYEPQYLMMSENTWKMLTSELPKFNAEVSESSEVDNWLYGLPVHFLPFPDGEVQVYHGPRGGPSDLVGKLNRPPWKW